MECLICYEELKEVEIDIPCKHTYHKECLEKWLDIQNNCPYCREFVKNKLINIKALFLFSSKDLIFEQNKPIKISKINVTFGNRKGYGFSNVIDFNKYTNNEYDSVIEECIKNYTKEFIDAVICCSFRCNQYVEEFDFTKEYWCILNK